MLVTKPSFFIESNIDSDHILKNVEKAGHATEIPPIHAPETEQ